MLKPTLFHYSSVFNFNVQCNHIWGIKIRKTTITANLPIRLYPHPFQNPMSPTKGMSTSDDVSESMEDTLHTLRLPSATQSPSGDNGTTDTPHLWRKFQSHVKHEHSHVMSNRLRGSMCRLLKACEMELTDSVSAHWHWKLYPSSTDNDLSLAKSPNGLSHSSTTILWHGEEQERCSNDRCWAAMAFNKAPVRWKPEGNLRSINWLFG